jgi:hypothetical protein
MIKEIRMIKVPERLYHATPLVRIQAKILLTGDLK